MKSPERSCAASSDATSARNGRLPSHASSRNALRSPRSRARAASNTSRARAHSLGFMEIAATDLACQPRFRQRPPALDRRRRYAQRFCRLLDREAPEEAYLDNAGKIWIEGRETGQRVIQCLEVDRLRNRH